MSLKYFLLLFYSILLMMDFHKISPYVFLEPSRALTFKPAMIAVLNVNTDNILSTALSV